jgi:hypothetical protein
VNGEAGGIGVSDENEKFGTHPKDVDVRKPVVRAGRADNAWSRKSLLVAAELLGGISNASAEAFHSLSSALEPEGVAERGLGASLLRGLVYGNARYFEVLSRTSTRVLDALSGPGGPD